MSDVGNKVPIKYGYRTLISVGGALMFGGVSADALLLAKVFELGTDVIDVGDFIAVFGIGTFLLTSGLFLQTYTQAQNHIVDSYIRAADSLTKAADEYRRRGREIGEGGDVP